MRLGTLGCADAPDEVRASCAWALGRMKPSRSISEALVASLHDGYRWVVFYALESLALHRDASVLPALRTIRAEREIAERDTVDDVIPHLDDAIAELEKTSENASD